MDRNELIAAMQITAAEKPIAVEIEGWGRVFVRPVTVAEVDEHQVEEEEGKMDKQRLAKGAARLICDETGARLFDSNNADDVKLLSQQGWWRLRKVINATGESIEKNLPSAKNS